MKGLQLRKDCNGYTFKKQLLFNLELEKSDYNWLLTNIEAYLQTNEINTLINTKEYLVLSTDDLMNR